MDSTQIDRSALKRLLAVLGNDPAELEDLLTDYCEDAPDLARRISDAAGSGDMDALRIAAHTLKSNAHDFGARHLSALCADLERACISGVPADPKASAEQIVGAEKAAREAVAL